MADRHAALMGMPAIPGITLIPPISEQQLEAQLSPCGMHEVQAKRGWAARSTPIIRITSWRTRFIGLEPIWPIVRPSSVIHITTVQSPTLWFIEARWRSPSLPD
jgi:hypothetical protein